MDGASACARLFVGFDNSPLTGVAIAENLATKLIREHLVDGSMTPGDPISLRVDQTLTQDATGTLVMLALEAMGVERVKTELSVQYVDHNIFQGDNRNPDDHLFLESACRRYGVWYSRPGNGVSHPLHMAYFGEPGKVLAGSDSHTPAAGALGMLGFGAGGLDVATAMAGEPLALKMPEIWGVRLAGELSPWVSAKDVILEMLRRHGVRGGSGAIIEYYGPGLRHLRAMDRHVIANMGTELGATSTVFPSDDLTREFLREHRRETAWCELLADDNASYDRHDEIDLSRLEPLIARPSSPGNVVKVSEVAGAPIYQAYIGSSANPGYRDFAIAAHMVCDRRIADGVSFDINPTSREIIETLVEEGLLNHLLHAGARLHQAGCNGCIGMGQAPATGRNSLRTVPRNFSGRSGTAEDCVYLCSPETAAASALAGKIVDPRTLDAPYPGSLAPQRPVINPEMFAAPPEPGESREVELVKGPNVRSLPEFDPLPDTLHVKVLLRVEDDISTDEILPAGAEVLPFRSDVDAISEFAFRAVDEAYAERAREAQSSDDVDGHAVIGGENYGQGSSREHAALAPRYLGLRVVLARSYARIHLQNLINYGVLPLIVEGGEVGEFGKGDIIVLDRLRQTLEQRDLEQEEKFRIQCEGKGEITAICELTRREREIILAGGLLNWIRERKENAL